MAAARKTCLSCAGQFQGRKDAQYCSTACRQRAYRRRSRNGFVVAGSVTGGSVTEGDEWMRDRFGQGSRGGYTPVSERPPEGLRFAEHRATDDSDGSEVIRDYVLGVTCIGQAVYDSTAGTSEHDLHTPLGRALPVRVDPGTAADLAAALRAAVPRIVELASLLEARGRMIPLRMKVPFVSAPVQPGPETSVGSDNMAVDSDNVSTRSSSPRELPVPGTPSTASMSDGPTRPDSAERSSAKVTAW